MTIQHSCMATPATGRTDGSASSTSSITSAQAEAETLNLRQRGPEPAHAGRPSPCDEPTVMVNRAPGRPAGTSALGSLRQGPRRLGELAALLGMHESRSALPARCCLLPAELCMDAGLPHVAGLQQEALKLGSLWKPLEACRELKANPVCESTLTQYSQVWEGAQQG